MREEQWSEPETWVWQEIRAGRIADFNARDGRQGSPLEPTTRQGWSEERKLGSDFLKQILLRQPYSAEIPAEGARIVGAWFAEPVELGHGRLVRQLWLENCRFERGATLEFLHINGSLSLESSAFAEQVADATSVDLSGAMVTGHVSLEGATFDCKLNMNGVDIARDLLMGEHTKFKDVDLAGAKIGGSLSLDGVTFDGELNMNGVDVAQHLFIGELAEFKDVDLTGAKVGGSLSLNGATFGGKLDMNSVHVTQGVFMHDGARFKDVGLTGAKIGGQLSLDSATLDGKLNMNGVDVAQDLFMREGAKFKDVDVRNAKVGGQLSLKGATVDGNLEMNGVDVAQSLLMHEGAKFKNVDLIGAKVGAQLNMKGVTFDGKLNMNRVQLAWDLLMGEGAKFKEVDLTSAKIGGQLNLDGATFDGKLNMGGVDVGEQLLMREGAKFKDVDLIGAKVGAQLNLNGATFDGKLNMNGVDVARDLLMGERAKFKDVDLGFAKVGGSVSADGATFESKLSVYGVDVRQDLFMRAGAKFKDVDLVSANIGGQLALERATFDGELNMQNLVVDGPVFMRDSTFNRRVRMLFARCGSYFDLSNSEFTEVDLSGTRIEAELRLGSDSHSMTRWRKGAAVGLNLRNVHVGALQDRMDRVGEQREKRWWGQRFGDRQRWEDAWPADLQLNGFTYDRLGGIGGTQGRDEKLQGNCDVDMQARDVRWYINWLARDHSYSAQPYEELARAFRAAGDPTKANHILYESRRRARADAWRRGEYLRWLASSLLNWTMGYGLGARYFRALAWVIAFTALGTGVLYFSGQRCDYFSGQPCDGLAQGLSARFVYSLDQLLPIVEFQKYDKVVLTGVVAYYFYVQKLLGWVLGSFLVAGLAGLTQKQ